MYVCMMYAYINIYNACVCVYMYIIYICTHTHTHVRIYVHSLPSFALVAPFVVHCAKPHHATVGAYVLPPTPSKFSTPHQAAMRYRMCGNVATVKYIRRKWGKGQGGTERGGREQKRGKRGREEDRARERTGNVCHIQI